MISGKIYVCLVILATANYLVAQDSQSEDEGPPEGGQGPPQGGEGPPQGDQGPRPPRPPPGFGSFDMSDYLNAGPRESEEADPGNEDDAGPQSRFFFSSFFNTRLVSCNYTTQAGTSCSNCRQILRCFSGNAGTLRTCTGFFPYCNNGRCSLFAETNCTSLG